MKLHDLCGCRRCIRQGNHSGESIAQMKAKRDKKKRDEERLAKEKEETKIEEITEDGSGHFFIGSKTLQGQYILAPPGTDEYGAIAAQLASLGPTLKKYAKIRAGEYDKVIDLRASQASARAKQGEDKGIKMMTDKEFEAKWEGGLRYASEGVLCVAKSTHAIAALFEACKSMGDTKIDVTLFKSTSDPAHSILDNRGIIAARAIKKAKQGKLSRIVLCTIAALDDLFSSVLTMLNPFLIVILESSSLDHQYAQRLVAKCNRGALERIVLVGDEMQMPPSDTADEKRMSAFDGIKTPSILTELLEAQSIPAPITEIISKRLYNGRLKPSSQVLADYKTEKPPFCFVVDCCDGFEKTKKGTIITGKGYIRNTPVINNIFTAAKLAKVYHEAGLSFTVIVVNEKTRSAISSRCRQLEMSDEFCKSSKITTLEQYQSGKADYTILVLEKSDGAGLVDDLQRQNVAVTRANKHLTLICDNKSMTSLFKDSIILQDLYQHKCSQYMSASKLLDAEAKEIQSHVGYVEQKVDKKGKGKAV